MAIDMREARQERAARNQSLFRDLNERLDDVMRELDSEQDFFCECADRECNEMVSVSQSEYELVRSVSTHFVIARGHELPESSTWSCTRGVGTASSRRSSERLRSPGCSIRATVRADERDCGMAKAPVTGRRGAKKGA